MGFLLVRPRNFFAALQQIRDRGDMALILVEQHTDLALEFSQRVIVMDRGQIVYQGSSESLKADPDQLSRVIGVGA